jgi:hypothetical protein
MEREAIRERLIDLVDGVLPPEEARRLEAEIARHPDLEQELADLREAVRLAGKLREVEMPADLSAGIRQALDACARPRRARVVPLWFVGSAAAAVLAIALGFVLLRRSGSPGDGDHVVVSRVDKPTLEAPRDAGPPPPAAGLTERDKGRFKEGLETETVEHEELEREEGTGSQDAFGGRSAGEGEARPEPPAAAPAPERPEVKGAVKEEKKEDRIGLLRERCKSAAGAVTPGEPESRDDGDADKRDEKASAGVRGARPEAGRGGRPTTDGDAPKKAAEGKPTAREKGGERRGVGGEKAPEPGKLRRGRPRETRRPQPVPTHEVTLEVDAARLEPAREALERFLKQDGVSARRPARAGFFFGRREAPDAADRQANEVRMEVSLTDGQATRLQKLLAQYGAVSSRPLPADARRRFHIGRKEGPAGEVAKKEPPPAAPNAPSPAPSAAEKPVAQGEPARGGEAAEEIPRRGLRKEAETQRGETKAKDAPAGPPAEEEPRARAGDALTPTAPSPRGDKKTDTAIRPDGEGRALRTWILVIRRR